MQLIALLLSALLLSAQSAPTLKAGTITPADVALAVSRIPRFPPDKFASLPPSVREVFAEMNCQVPQTTVTGAPMNVGSGEFAAKGQRDWGALCSNGTTSEIRVVWGGARRCEDRLASRQDSDTLVAVAPGQFGYSRSLAPVTLEQITRYLVRFRTTLSEEPAHDAIEDTIDRAGFVHYCAGGHWQTIP
ncbi:MAG TPA: hypothetical protein VEK56_17005 [Vicinamibacterales bacterium]|nr:hypothetical protein [Vicinamibacterales bacterium]